jgi:hypothetical protein
MDGTKDLIEQQPDKLHKQYCANCFNCKLKVIHDNKNHTFVLRIRCDKNHWSNPILYKYHTVNLRRCENCPDYDSQGEDDRYDFLQHLRKALPAKDIIYNEGDKI